MDDVRFVMEDGKVVIIRNGVVDGSIDEYISLDRQIKELEAKRDKLANQIKADMLTAGIDKAEGKDGYIKLSVVADKVMPAKDAYLKKGYSYLRVYR